MSYNSYPIYGLPGNPYFCASTEETMKRYLLYISILCLAFGLSGCELIEYHPYEVRINYRNINAENIERIETACAGKEKIRFVWMGDTQRWYDETEDFVRHVNARTDIDFVMHGGDISDFGLQREFEWIHEDMRRLRVPYVALIGNHDLLGNGLYVYERMYGPLNFSFLAGHTKFVCLNTNALEFDYSHPVPDFEYILGECADQTPAVRQTVVAMHANPFGDQFNNNVARPFQAYIKRLPNLRFCLHAHAHSLMENDYFNDGIVYYGCEAMKRRSYMVFTITPEEYEYEVVYY